MGFQLSHVDICIHVHLNVYGKIFTYIIRFGLRIVRSIYVLSDDKADLNTHTYIYIYIYIYSWKMIYLSRPSNIFVSVSLVVIVVCNTHTHRTTTTTTTTTYGAGLSFISGNAFERIVCKVEVILFKPACVKPVVSATQLFSACYPKPHYDWGMFTSAS